MAERFLQLADFYGRKGGRDAVLRPIAHLFPTEAEQDTESSRALAWAETRFEAYTPQYRDRLPISPEATPEAIKDLVADLARWRLESTHSDMPTPSIVEIGQRAMRDLEELQSGRRQLMLPLLVDKKRPSVYVQDDSEDPHFDHAGAARGMRF